MARKKIKLITFDLDDTVWPNKKVILDAEWAKDIYVDECEWLISKDAG